MLGVVLKPCRNGALASARAVCRRRRCERGGLWAWVRLRLPHNERTVAYGTHCFVALGLIHCPGSTLLYTTLRTAPDSRRFLAPLAFPKRWCTTQRTRTTSPPCRARPPGCQRCSATPRAALARRTARREAGRQAGGRCETIARDRRGGSQEGGMRIRPGGMSVNCKSTHLRYYLDMTLIVVIENASLNGCNRSRIDF